MIVTPRPSALRFALCAISSSLSSFFCSSERFQVGVTVQDGATIHSVESACFCSSSLFSRSRGDCRKRPKIGAGRRSVSAATQVILAKETGFR